jgi:hypothetical protein
MPEKTRRPTSAQHHNTASEQEAIANHGREAAPHHDPGEHEHAEKHTVSARILARMRSANQRLPANTPSSR